MSKNFEASIIFPMKNNKVTPLADVMDSNHGDGLFTVTSFRISLVYTHPNGGGYRSRTDDPLRARQVL